MWDVRNDEFLYIVKWKISVWRFEELKHWTTPEIVKIKSEKIYNFKNRILEDQTMKIKNISTMIRETGNINDWHAISEYSNKTFNKLITFLTKEEFSIVFEVTSSVIFILRRFSRYRLAERSTITFPKASSSTIWNKY